MLDKGKVNGFPYRIVIIRKVAEWLDIAIALRESSSLIDIFGR